MIEDGRVVGAGRWRRLVAMAESCSLTPAFSRFRASDATLRAGQRLRALDLALTLDSWVHSWQDTPAQLHRPGSVLNCDNGALSSSIGDKGRAPALPGKEALAPHTHAPASSHNGVQRIDGAGAIARRSGSQPRAALPSAGRIRSP